MNRPKVPRGDPFRCAECLSRAAGIFCDLGQSALADLDRARVSRRLFKGDTLYAEGARLTGFYCVRVGRMKLFKTTPDGSEYILRIVQPGQVLGLESIASERPATSSAQMLEDGIVCQTDRQIVLDLVKRDPSTAVRVIEALVEQLGASNEQRFAMASLSVRERTARVLALFARSHGTSEKTGVLIRLPVTRQTLGQMVAAAPETVMRAIQSLREEGILEGRGKTVRVLDLDRLLDAASLTEKGDGPPDARSGGGHTSTP